METQQISNLSESSEEFNEDPAETNNKLENSFKRGDIRELLANIFDSDQEDDYCLDIQTTANNDGKHSKEAIDESEGCHPTRVEDFASALQEKDVNLQLSLILEEEYYRRCDLQQKLQLSDRDINYWMRKRKEIQEKERGKEGRELISFRKYKQYSQEELRAALREIEEGNSIIKTGRKYGIPSRTLYDRVKKEGLRQKSRESFPEDQVTAVLQAFDIEDNQSHPDHQLSTESLDVDLDVGLDPLDILELVIDIDDQ